MWKSLLSTTDQTELTLIRVALGVVMFPHAAQKLLGWFGGGGIHGTMDAFTNQLGIPAVFAALAIVAEVGGSLGLITGFLGRVAALGILINMSVAVALIHGKVGFFINWSGQQKGEGFEYHILAIAMALLIIWKGSGAYSVDRTLTRPA